MTGTGNGGRADGPVRVFVLDDQDTVRSGMRALLSADPGIEVVGDASTATSALTQVPGLGIDVAVLDVRLLDGNGVAVCRDIRSELPTVACLMITGYSDEEALLQAIMAGAAGYVLKAEMAAELVNAVHAVARGGAMLGPASARRVLARLRGGTNAVASPLASLSAQEKRVLRLIGEGMTNPEIAGQMFLSDDQAREYVSSLLVKLGLQRRSQVATLASRVMGVRGP